MHGDSQQFPFKSKFEGFEKFLRSTKSFPPGAATVESGCGQKGRMVKIRGIVPLVRNKWTSYIRFHKMDHVILSGEFLLFVLS